MEYLKTLLGINCQAKTMLVTSPDIKAQILKYRMDNHIIDNLKIMSEYEFIETFIYQNEITKILEYNNYDQSTNPKVEVIENILQALYIVCANDIKNHHMYDLANQLFAGQVVKKLNINYQIKTYLPRVSDFLYTLDEIEISNRKVIDISSCQILMFDYYMNEIQYAIESICQKLIADTKIEDIIIYAPNAYVPIIMQMCILYNIPLKTINKTKLLSHEDGFRCYQNILKLDEEYLAKVDPLVASTVVEILNKYASYERRDVIKLIKADFEKANIVNQTTSGLIVKTKIDSLYTSTDFTNKHFYILGNYQDGLVSYHKDTNIISDKYRDKLPMIKLQNENEDYLLHRIMTSATNLFISYSIKVETKEVTVANNIKSCKLVVTNSLVSSRYSEDVNKLVFARANYIKDSLNYESPIYKQLKDCISLDLKNNKVGPIDRSYENLKLSYTSINDYYKCSYKFYLKYILRLKNGNVASDAMIIGNITHYVLERLDEITDTSYAHIMKMISNYLTLENYQLTDVEKLYINKLAKYLEHVCTYMKSEEAASDVNKIEREKNIEIEIKQNISLIGKIDKVFSNIDNDDLLVEIFDYKTGKLSIDLTLIDYGLNMQNLIYFLLIQQYYKHEDGQEILISTYQQSLKQNLLYDEQDILETMKIKGYSVKKDEYIFKRQTTQLKSEQFMQMSEKVLEKVMLAIDDIESNKFKINPLIINLQNKSCAYCEYASICNKKQSDFTYISLEKK